MAKLVTELIAFTPEHVSRLTGLSLRQLRYWDATGFFAPTLIDDHGRKNFGRVYSFRDLVGLRTISILRDRVPLQELRRVGERLKQEHETPWSSIRFGLLGRRVVMYDPKSGQPTEPLREGQGQRVLPVAVSEIAAKMRSAAEKLRRRTAAEFGKIVRNRYVVHNAYVVAGTRIPSRAVWNFHQAGFSRTAIIREYPRLTRADVDAAIVFESSRQKAA